MYSILMRFPLLFFTPLRGMANLDVHLAFFFPTPAECDLTRWSQVPTWQRKWRLCSASPSTRPFWVLVRCYYISSVESVIPWYGCMLWLLPHSYPGTWGLCCAQGVHSKPWQGGMGGNGQSVFFICKGEWLVALTEMQIFTAFLSWMYQLEQRWYKFTHVWLACAEPRQALAFLVVIDILGNLQHSMLYFFKCLVPPCSRLPTLRSHVFSSRMPKH